MRIKYHNYFYKALQLYLKDYLDKINIHNEVYLAEEPIRVDYLVVKKNTKINIELDIAKIFRKYNIIEFKSPEDYISIDDYYKALSYVFYYKATNLVEDKKKRNINDIKINEITLTLFSNHYPRKLIKHLTSYNKYIDEKKPGLYQIHGEIFPVQLIKASDIKNVKQNYSLIPFGNNNLLNEATSKILNNYKDKNIQEILEYLYQKYPKTTMEVSLMDNNKVEEEAVNYIFDKMEKEGFEPYLNKMKKWENEGKLQEAKKIILKQLRKKFSHIPDDIKVILEEKTEDELEKIAEDIIDIDSVNELKQYLNNEA